MKKYVAYITSDTIDVFSDENFYIILKNSKRFVLVSKAINSVTDVKRYFGIND